MTLAVLMVMRATKMVLGLGGLMLVTACGSADAEHASSGSAATSASGSPSGSESVAASKDTTAALGVTSWNAADGADESSVVFTGQDAAGKVVARIVIAIAADDKGVETVSMRSELQGPAEVDSVNGAITSNTFPQHADAQKMLDLAKADIAKNGIPGDVKGPTSLLTTKAIPELGTNLSLSTVLSRSGQKLVCGWVQEGKTVEECDEPPSYWTTAGHCLTTVGMGAQCKDDMNQRKYCLCSTECVANCQAMNPRADCATNCQGR